MSTQTNDNKHAGESAIARRLDIRPIMIDDLAAVRALHRTAVRSLAGEQLEEAELSAMQAAMGAASYIEGVMRAHPLGGWLDGRLVGTAGWLRTIDRNTVARIEYVYVDPLFTRLGIGRKLVGQAEAAALSAGFSEFSARPTFNAVRFFERLGYQATSFGVKQISPDVSVQIAHMRRETTAPTRPEPVTRPQAQARLPAHPHIKPGSKGAPNPSR